MKKNKNLYFIVCDGFYLTTSHSTPHFASNCPWIFTNYKSACARMAFISAHFGYSFRDVRVVKVVIDNA